MMDYLLTFEIDESSEQVSIHGDPEGLAFLAKELLKLAERAKSGDFPHDHYFTEEWGGYQLSSEQQSEKDRLVNHVKIYGWPTKEGGRPYR
ncbi:Imm32 family immunity protein [Alloalcanivorax gelatiniphagus]|uniref:Methylhydantoinase n=1 Tax=Alloalcanivorax gelatiniphagus TaxID=1194167 RepID=A0ABY2XJ55_9GAMM|nr:Imm32 family immunity protein [Alloalcanivorax gelatiniphagus]TMW11932.1 methylhydantoinase [Alloalcanivorax gelatiniphagus]